ncbi:MAG: hypothetical protein R2854_26885 [Caldilineaceae bacterium]
MGKLSAGMAHELNNPVAAVLRGTEHIATALADQTRAHLALDRGGLTPAQVGALGALNARRRRPPVTPAHWMH